MSYCRWSSDNFDCDLYCYEDCRGGYTTHVAGNRHLGEIPKLLPWNDTDTEVWCARYKEQLDWLGTCERRPIGLPHDGQTFNDPDLPSFLARVQCLRALGYHCPLEVDEAIKAEMEET